MTGAIQKATQEQAKGNLANQAHSGAKKSVNALLSSMLDSEGYRRRFNELLGVRTPQFISSIVSLVNADANLQQAFYEAPLTVIQSALKAATFNLPIDPNLGYAYIVPFNNRHKNQDGTETKRMEASFIMGYKGMHQLALRTGVYKKINVVEIREGELKSYNRLTEDIDLDFVEDDEQREKLPIIGWVGYYRLMNGTEKTIYMTRKQIEAHERKYRKGQYMGKGWRENFNEMAMKTVYRRLIGKWGLMSIDYQKQVEPGTLAAADALAKGQFDDEDTLPPAPPVQPINTEGKEIDPATGEVQPK